MKIHQIVRRLLVIANLAALAVPAKTQSLFDSGDSSGPVGMMNPAHHGLTYSRPTKTTKVRNYLFHAFGPYPIVGAALAAGFDQPRNAPSMGNYNLLEYVGGNISLDFLYSGPHSLLTRMHLNNGHGAPNSGLEPSSTGAVYK